MKGALLGMLERAEEKGSWVVEATAARELVQRHGEGCLHSGNLFQGSCTLSGCKKETLICQESRPGKKTPKI